jgi:hypothetical protein
MKSHLGNAGAAWGILGAIGLLASAVIRLLPAAREAFTARPLDAAHWTGAIAAAALVGFFMGHRGLERGFAPRVVSRALYLARHPRLAHALVAPLFCIGLVHASRRRLVASWALVAAMVTLVLLVRELPQPYRGFVDAGVVIGAAWGALAVLAFAWRAVSGRPPAMPVELPGAGAWHAS